MASPESMYNLGGISNMKNDGPGELPSAQTATGWPAPAPDETGGDEATSPQTLVVVHNGEPIGPAMPIPTYHDAPEAEIPQEPVHSDVTPSSALVAAALDHPGIGGSPKARTIGEKIDSFIAGLPLRGAQTTGHHIARQSPSKDIVPVEPPVVKPSYLEKINTRYAEKRGYSEGTIPQIPLDSFLREAGQGASTALIDRLPPNLKKSPGVPLLASMAIMGATAAFNDQTGRAEKPDILSSMLGQPNRTNHKRNERLGILVQNSIDTGVSSVVVAMSEIESEQRAMDDLFGASVTTETAAGGDNDIQNAIVVQFPGDDGLYIKTEQLDALFRKQAVPGGEVLGRCANVGTQQRLGDDRYEVFREIFFTVKDHKDPEILHHLVVTAGIACAPGAQKVWLNNGLPEWDKGWCRVESVPLKGRRFESMLIESTGALYPGASMNADGEGRYPSDVEPVKGNYPHSNFVSAIRPGIIGDVMGIMTNPQQIGYPGDEF